MLIEILRVCRQLIRIIVPFNCALLLASITPANHILKRMGLIVPIAYWLLFSTLGIALGLAFELVASAMWKDKEFSLPPSWSRGLWWDALLAIVWIAVATVFAASGAASFGAG